jgi:hypothetical protein
VESGYHARACYRSLLCFDRRAVVCFWLSDEKYQVAEIFVTWRNQAPPVENPDNLSACTEFPDFLCRRYGVGQDMLD